MKQVQLSILSALLLTFFSFSAFALDSDQLPNCLSDGRELAVNNETVLEWKKNTKNTFKSRAHIKGLLVKELPDFSGHNHWLVQIGNDSKDLIEVIYNQKFGSVPSTQPGDEIEACGDYITSTARTGKLAPSPAGAIIHWVHESPNPDRHDSGYLIVKGVVCGMNGQYNSRR